MKTVVNYLPKRFKERFMKIFRILLVACRTFDSHTVVINFNLECFGVENQYFPRMLRLPTPIFFVINVL